MAKGRPGYLRYRVIKRHDGGDAEITTDLAHLHQSTWKDVGMQPGQPSSSAIGTFRIPLFPPGTRQFRLNRAFYDQLARFQRVEGYLGYSATDIPIAAGSPNNLAFAGIIRQILKTNGPNARFELVGQTDPCLANLSRPFPAELLSNDVDSAMLKSFLGGNELNWADAFNPYTSGNYTPTNQSGGAQGTWAGTTDNGLHVVSNSTGIGAALIASTGASANDRWHTMYVEAVGRLQPSTDANNAGRLGVGLSQSSANVVTNTALFAFVTARLVQGRYVLDVTAQSFNGGASVQLFKVSAALNNVDDVGGFIPIEIGLLVTDGGGSAVTPNISVIVNGTIVIGRFATGCASLGTTTFYPLLYSDKPATGTATTFLTNLQHFTRFSTDGPSTAAQFGNGSITASTNSLQFGVDPGPSFLDAWSRFATREGWYWRYTPQPYVVGTRTLGVVDFAADPGVDRSKGAANRNVIFSRREGNLVELSLDENADAMSASSEVTGQSTLDGGGIASWTDIATMQAIGVYEDQILAGTAADFNSLQQAARNIVGNKVSAGAAGTKTAIVLRDASTSDAYRVLDKVTIDDPEMNINMQTARILARGFTEGMPTEELVLDQFSWHGREFEA